MYEGQQPEKALPESAQLQWVIQGMGAYNTLKVTLENHITNITNKVDSNHEILKEKLDDKHDSALARMDDRCGVLQEKIDALQIKMDERCNTLQEKMDERCNALQTKMDERCDALQTRMDERCSALQEKMDERCSALQARMDIRCDALQEKIDDKYNILVQSILRSEQSVLNQIKDMQSANLKWFIGIIVGTGIAFYKVFTMSPWGWNSANFFLLFNELNIDRSLLKQKSQKVA
nr:hypothetical protein [Providencia alcalifaciens]